MGILYLIMGVLMAVLGKDSLNIIIMIAGAFALVFGLITVAATFKNGMGPGIVTGVVLVVFGLLLLILPGLFSDLLMIILGAGLIIVGLITLLGASSSFAISFGSKMLTMAIAALMVVMGVYALLNVNDTADIVMIVIGAIVALSGLMGIIAAVKLKNA